MPIAAGDFEQVLNTIIPTFYLVSVGATTGSSFTSWASTPSTSPRDSLTSPVVLPRYSDGDEMSVSGFEGRWWRLVLARDTTYRSILTR